MRRKLDENVPIDAADLLRQAGHECETVHTESLSGASDERLITVCRGEQRVLITLDLDFSDLRRYPPAESPGIIVLRPAEPDAERVLRLLARTLPPHLHDRPYVGCRVTASSAAADARS